MSRVESLANHLAPPPVRALFHPAGAKLQPRYDIIVVGAGSAGCALAADLAARLPKASVLLIEAGGTNQMFRVASPFITCPDLQNSELDWAYRTTPQPLQQNRPSFWPRGKTLGGSSSINFMLAVRGCPNGYEEWAEKHGCGPEWGFAACERFFRQLEDYTGSRHLPRRGKQGKLKIRDCRDDPNVPTRPVCEAFLQGCAAEGVPVSEDYNAPHAHAGCGLSQTTIFPNGYRCDTASAFLFGEAGVRGCGAAGRAGLTWRAAGAPYLQEPERAVRRAGGAPGHVGGPALHGRGVLRRRSGERARGGAERGGRGLAAHPAAQRDWVRFAKIGRADGCCARTGPRPICRARASRCTRTSPAWAAGSRTT
jgi:hypothetical protein